MLGYVYMPVVFMILSIGFVVVFAFLPNTPQFYLRRHRYEVWILKSPCFFLCKSSKFLLLYRKRKVRWNIIKVTRAIRKKRLLRLPWNSNVWKSWPNEKKTAKDFNWLIYVRIAYIMCFSTKCSHSPNCTNLNHKNHLRRQPSSNKRNTNRGFSCNTRSGIGQYSIKHVCNTSV